MIVYGSKDFRSGVFAAWAHAVAVLKTHVDLLAPLLTPGLSHGMSQISPSKSQILASSSDSDPLKKFFFINFMHV